MDNDKKLDLHRMRKGNAYHLAILEIACKYGDGINGSVYFSEDPARIEIWFPVTDEADRKALNRLGYHHVSGRTWTGPRKEEVWDYIEAYIEANPFPTKPPPPTEEEVFKKAMG